MPNGIISVGINPAQKGVPYLQSNLQKIKNVEVIKFDNGKVSTTYKDAHNNNLITKYTNKDSKEIEYIIATKQEGMSAIRAYDYDGDGNIDRYTYNSSFTKDEKGNIINNEQNYVSRNDSGEDDFIKCSPAKTKIPVWYNPFTW